MQNNYIKHLRIDKEMKDMIKEARKGMGLKEGNFLRSLLKKALKEVKRKAKEEGYENLVFGGFEINPVKSNR